MKKIEVSKQKQLFLMKKILFFQKMNKKYLKNNHFTLMFTT